MFHVSNKKPPWVFFNPSIHYPILKSYSLHGWRFSAIFRIGEIICEIPEISGGWSKQRDAAAARPLPHPAAYSTRQISLGYLAGGVSSGMRRRPDRCRWFCPPPPAAALP